MKIDSDEWLAGVMGIDVFRVSLDRASSNGSAPDIEPLALHMERPERSMYFAKFPTDRVYTLRALSSVGFDVVDVNVTFGRSPAGPVGPVPDGVRVIEDALPEHREAVLEIAQTSFVYSRFHLDPNILKATADLIKREWIANYVNRKRGERLMVALVDGQPAGFLAVLDAVVADRPCRVIDLIGVDRRHQGRGVGRALVSAFTGRYVGVCDLLRVGTQAANVPSARLYERSGFLLDETSYVMHAHTGAGRILK